MVKENAWSGWQAQVDGQGVGLEPHRWLRLRLPAGEHQVRLRYRPWDVLLGCLLSLGGLALVVQQWRKPDPPAPRPAARW